MEFGSRVAFALLYITAGPAAAALAATAPGTPGGPVARASRCDRSIKIDGLLDEPCWQGAEPLASFVQRLPAEGSPATQPTDVRLLFDDENLYVGAELTDAEPGRIF